MTINQILLELRKERGLSQQQVADAVGISQSTIAKIEINRNEATASTIRKLSEFFNVSADYLLGVEEVIAPAKRAGGTLSEKDELLLRYFHMLPDELQAIAIDTVRVLAGAPAGDLQKKA